MFMDGLDAGETFDFNEPASQESHHKPYHRAESSSEKATKMTSFEVPVLALSVLVGKTRTWRRRRKEKRRREAEALGLNELGKRGIWGEPRNRKGLTQ